MECEAYEFPTCAWGQIESETPMSDESAPITVLLVDDQRFIGLAVERLLAAEPDITLHACDTAQDAISRANAIKPSIILQDLVMPGISGLQLVALFRQNPSTARTPIVVLSGNEDAESRARALAAGANDYLLKLPSRDVLVACIRAHVAGHARPQSAAASQTPVAPDAGSGQTLDRDVIALFCDRDGALSTFARALIAQFTREAESQAATLRDAVRSQDHDLLKMTAHSLKGSSLTVGAKRLGGLCRQLEDDGCRQPEQAALVAALEEELVRVRKAFGDL
jgi:CheY-like chemotaxis protein/HPt (histidine-containing phosphotransfer) domain-containing protein